MSVKNIKWNFFPVINKNRKLLKNFGYAKLSSKFVERLLKTMMLSAGISFHPKGAKHFFFKLMHLYQRFLSSVFFLPVG